jgi:hypothetical protein
VATTHRTDRQWRQRDNRRPAPVPAHAIARIDAPVRSSAVHVLEHQTERIRADQEWCEVPSGSSIIALLGRRLGSSTR